MDSDWVVNLGPSQYLLLEMRSWINCAVFTATILAFGPHEGTKTRSHEFLFWKKQIFGTSCLRSFVSRGAYAIGLSRRVYRPNVVDVRRIMSG
jgi:hypothetical protein